ncbi:MAG: hypothetical protein ACK4GN_01480 [Runella sp.]
MVHRIKILKISYLLYYILLYSSSYSQISTIGGGSTFLPSSLDNPDYADKGGTPYIPLEFKKALATKSSGETDTIMARLDTYGGYIEILRNDKKVSISSGTYMQISFLFFEEGFLTFRNGYINPDYSNIKTYYQVLYEGKIQLLKLTYHNLRDCYEYGGVYRQCFQKQEKLYLKSPKYLSLLQLDNNAGKIWDYLDDAPKWREYAASNKLKTKRLSDLIKILEAYDSQK